MRIKLIVFPDDPELRARAQSLLDGGAETPRVLEDWLRADYPRVKVVDGIDDGAHRRWYVYREGRWQGSGRVMTPPPTAAFR